jgi:hypothetical protein
MVHTRAHAHAQARTERERERDSQCRDLQCSVSFDTGGSPRLPKMGQLVLTTDAHFTSLLLKVNARTTMYISPQGFQNGKKRMRMKGSKSGTLTRASSFLLFRQLIRTCVVRMEVQEGRPGSARRCRGQVTQPCRTNFTCNSSHASGWCAPFTRITRAQLHCRPQARCTQIQIPSTVAFSFLQLPAARFEHKRSRNGIVPLHSVRRTRAELRCLRPACTSSTRVELRRHCGGREREHLAILLYRFRQHGQRADTEVLLGRLAWISHASIALARMRGLRCSFSACCTLT